MLTRNYRSNVFIKLFCFRVELSEPVLFNQINTAVKILHIDQIYQRMQEYQHLLWTIIINYVSLRNMNYVN